MATDILLKCLCQDANATFSGLESASDRKQMFKQLLHRKACNEIQRLAEVLQDALGGPFRDTGVLTFQASGAGASLTTRFTPLEEFLAKNDPQRHLDRAAVPFRKIDTSIDTHIAPSGEVCYGLESITRTYFDDDRGEYDAPVRHGENPAPCPEKRLAPTSFQGTDEGLAQALAHIVQTLGAELEFHNTQYARLFASLPVRSSNLTGTTPVFVPYS